MKFRLDVKITNTFNKQNYGQFFKHVYQLSIKLSQLRRLAQSLYLLALMVL